MAGESATACRTRTIIVSCRSIGCTLVGDGEEIRQATEAAVNDIRERGYGNLFIALRDIANIFFKRNIDLKDLQAWVEQAQPNCAEILRRDSIGGPDGMILTVRARLLLRNENSAEAEQILRRLLAVSGEERKIYSAEYSYYLAEILARQGKKDEAMELYAVAAAHSGGSLPLAESNLRHSTKN